MADDRKGKSKARVSRFGASPDDMIESESTGASLAGEGFKQETAMLDKAALLGELAEGDEVPGTRPAVEADRSPPLGCRLIIVAGPDIGAEWAFKKPEIVMGRDEDCELFLADIAVSRRHAKITLEGMHFVLSDLGSGNGTILNGQRIDREVLSSGDEIIVGERTLRFVELNEAPSTAAAHPVPKRFGDEPLPGSVPRVSQFKEPAIKRSEVKVDAIPGKEGPGGSVIAPVVEPGKKGMRQGAALRSVVLASGLVLLLGALAGTTYWFFKIRRTEDHVGAALVVARREFLQGVELVKKRRFVDARVLFERVLTTRPDYTRAIDYRDHCAREVEIAKIVEDAGRAAATGKFKEALEQLDAIKDDTAHRDEITRAKVRYARSIADAYVKEAKKRFDAGDLDGALEMTIAALAEAPSLDSAQSLRDKIEDAKQRQKQKPDKKKEETPPEMVRAVALYKNEQLGAAIDAAEAAGGSNAPIFVAKMTRMKELLADAEFAHKKKAAGELLRISPVALDLDQQIALGDGKTRLKIRRFYADALYLKGIESYAEQDFVRAYQLLADALVQQPGHALSESRMEELGRKAHDLYFEGFVLRGSNIPEARKIFKRVIQMTSRDDQYHKLAKTWLDANGGQKE